MINQIFIVSLVGCTTEVSTDPCAISISIKNLGAAPHFDKYDAWKVGDTKLDWHGGEPGQGIYSGPPAQPPHGTGSVMTSNIPGNADYHSLNT